MFYKENCEILPKSLVNTLDGLDDFFCYENGLRHNGKLYASRNKAFEYENIYEKVDTNSEALCVFGCLDGRYIDRMLTDYKKLKYLVLVFVNLSEMKSFITSYDLTHIMNKELHVELVFSNHYIELLEKFYAIGENTTRVSYVSHPMYVIDYEEVYENFKSAYSKSFMIMRDNINTIYQSYVQWGVNQIRNMKYSYDEFENMHELVSNKNVVIVAAGPSLDKNIHLIEEIAKHALIVAAGSAIRILDKRGIIPDLRIAIDGMPREMKLVGEVNDTHVPLVYAGMLYQDFLPLYEGRKFSVVLDNEPITKSIISGMNMQRPVYITGGSVTNTAFDIFTRMGAKSITLIGQDLCYTGGELHAKGAWEDKSRKIGDMGFELIDTVDIYNNKVYTIKPFLAVKHSYEMYVRAVKGKYKTVYYNATEGGLNIEGIDNYKLGEILDLISDDESVKFDKSEPCLNNEFRESLKKIFMVHLVELDKCYDCIIQMEKQYFRLKKMSMHKTSQIEREFSYYEKLLQNLKVNEMFDIYFKKIYKVYGTVSTSADSTQSDYEKRIKKIGLILTGLKMNAIAYYKTIESELKYLEDINE